MKFAAFNATCPYEIGDKIQTYAASNTPSDKQINIMGVNLNLETHEITNIASIHLIKTGRVFFKYELDNSGTYVNLL
jgi:hypothetical protein